MLARATAGCLLLAALAAGCSGGGEAGRSLTGTWEAPVDLSRPGERANTPHVAVGADGRAAAIWTSTPEQGPTRVLVRGAERPAGGRWSRPVTISSHGSASAVQIAVDADGGAIAMWSALEGRRFSVQAATRSSAGTWSAPERLSAAGESATSPSVALDAKGDALAVWQRTRAGASSIQSSTRPAGGDWGTAAELARVSTTSGADSAQPHVAVGAKGDAAAVWTDDGAVQAALKPAGGVWRTPQALTARAGSSVAAQVVVDGAGNVVAAWLDDTGSVVRASVHAPGGHWGTPKRISRIRQMAGGPRLATGGRDTTIAVWTTFSGVASATLRPGDGWQAPVDISGRADAFSTPVAMSSRGDAVAVWIGDDGGSEQGAVRAAGGRWQTPHDLAPRTPGQEAAGANISVGVDPRGAVAVAVWSRPIDADSVVQATTRPLGG